MSSALVQSIGRYTDLHADAEGVARTPIPALSLVRTSSTGELRYGVQRPLVCLVVQGAKRVTMGGDTLTFAAGDSMLITADAPSVSQIVRASREVPYLSLVLDLDPAIIADVATEMRVVLAEVSAPLRLQPTDAETAEAALRMIRVLDRPQPLAVLQAQMVREMHYWLMSGRHGPAMRHLGFPDGQARRIARAVKLIRADFASTLRVEQLASVAGMSVSSFHQHFRAVTSLSPVQFQKQLRLIEARRLMLGESTAPSEAAYAVGYQSVSQFTRDYHRLFGAPPVRETEEARRRTRQAV